MRKVLLSTMVALCMTILMTGVAFAAHSVGSEGDRTYPDFRGVVDASGCAKCHSTATKHTSGPHGGYSAATTKCAACHTVHKAGNARLLPGTTVTAACNYCHDLTGTTEGPYSLDKIPNFSDIKSAHRVSGVAYFNGKTEWDNAGSGVIPGGDATTGGDAALTPNAGTSKQGKLSGTTFTCDSCHTPHAVVDTTVEKYLGESNVKASSNGMNDMNGRKLYLTDRILKKSINGKEATVYGTAWCATCHQGRDNMGLATNHPVNETAAAYNFLEPGMTPTPLLTDKTTVTTKGYVYIDKTNTFAGRDFTEDPRTNMRLAMLSEDPLNGNAARPDGFVPYNNEATAGSAANAGPSCQQCHGSARDVEAKFWTDFKTTPLDGQMTFPHISTNKALLVETGDDFCTNCHGLNLP